MSGASNPVVLRSMTEEIGPGEFYPVVGVGPHPKPWPTNPHFDPDLLEHGDRRNVLNKYRYWSVAAIVAELDKTRSAFHVAIENWQHDLNIGSIVRTANAFNAAGVHIIGKKDWNRRGAMVTDKYLHVYHHPDVNTFMIWAQDHNLPILAIDNIEGSISLETAKLPKDCIFLFGQEGPGLSDEAKDCASTLLSIQQHGSTRSMNASAAGAIVMFAWGLQHLSVD